MKVAIRYPLSAVRCPLEAPRKIEAFFLHTKLEESVEVRVVASSG